MDFKLSIDVSIILVFVTLVLDRMRLCLVNCCFPVDLLSQGADFHDASSLHV